MTADAGLENGPIDYCSFTSNRKQVTEKQRQLQNSGGTQPQPGGRGGPGLTSGGCGAGPGQFSLHPFLFPLPFLSQFLWPSYHSVNYSIASSKFTVGVRELKWTNSLDCKNIPCCEIQFQLFSTLLEFGDPYLVHHRNVLRTLWGSEQRFFQKAAW